MKSTGKPSTKVQKDAVRKTGQGHTMKGSTQKFTPSGMNPHPGKKIDPCSSMGYRPMEKQG